MVLYSYVSANLYLLQIAVKGQLPFGVLCMPFQQVTPLLVPDSQLSAHNRLLCGVHTINTQLKMFNTVGLY